MFTRLIGSMKEQIPVLILWLWNVAFSAYILRESTFENSVSALHVVSRTTRKHKIPFLHESNDHCDKNGIQIARMLRNNTLWIKTVVFAVTYTKINSSEVAVSHFPPVTRLHVCYDSGKTVNKKAKTRSASQGQRYNPKNSWPFTQVFHTAKRHTTEKGDRSHTILHVTRLRSIWDWKCVFRQLNLRSVWVD